MKTGVLQPVNDGLRDLTVPMTSLHASLGISPWILVASSSPATRYATT